MEDEYNRVVAAFPSPALAEMFFLTFTSTVLYWSLGFIYYLIDVVEKPNFFFKYKIQRSTNFDYSHLGKIFRQILSNQALQFVLGAVFVWLKHEYGSVQQELPKPSRLLYEVFVFVILREIGFYY